ncbi:MAG: hypothetical protein N7Q72_00925, partial [Spiroplasma sp. Tabriz.8]|nr:hypothetical protein [Spiroplasma sp. Tabriz.8]
SIYWKHIITCIWYHLVRSIWLVGQLKWDRQTCVRKKIYTYIYIYIYIGICYTSFLSLVI